MLDATIPVVDLRDHRSSERREAFVRALGAGLEEFGFVAVAGHGIDEVLLERAYGVAREVFALPEGVKQGYETPEDGRQRGYTSFGVEHAKDVAVPDLKEFWHIGRRLAAGHPLSVEVPDNRFPSQVPAFGEVFSELFLQMEDFANRLLDAVGEYLGRTPDFFRDMVTDGNSVIRVIHYPDMGDRYVPGAVRAARHEDINLMTVLPASTQPGLELLTRDGTWMAVQTPPGVMVCDTGDMMQLLTEGRLPATTHRVVNPPVPDGGRLSMPFFLHPHPNHVLRSMHSEDGEGVLARDFLKQRLEAIGVA